MFFIYLGLQTAPSKNNNIQYVEDSGTPRTIIKIKGDVLTAGQYYRRFENLEDAIKCARYVYKNYSSELSDEIYSEIEVRDGLNQYAFGINAIRNRDEIGKEETFTDEAEKIVAELDVEKSADENEIVTPTENINATEKKSPIQKLADDEKNLSNETENLTDINEVAISKEKLNELFENVNVTDEFSKLQNTKPLFVSNDISQNVQEGQLKKAAIDAFTEKYPEGVEVDTTIGEVKISRRSIRESLAHSIYNAKADAVLSLPEGIKNAAYIGKLQDFEGKGIVNHYFAYPIQYDGEKHYVFCRVREQPFEERRFYIHDIFSDKEIIEKSNTLSQTQPPVNGQVQLRGVALYRAILTNFFAKGNIDNLKKSAKENPFEGMNFKNFKKLTYKRDRNGRPIYYVNGKRVSKYEYLDAGSEMISKKSDILIEKFENATNIKSEERHSNKAVIIHFPEGISSCKFFNTWEDAIKCAHYIYNNFTGIESVGVGNRYEEYFVVDKDGEKILADDFRDILDGTYKKKLLEEFGKLSQTGDGSTKIRNIVDDKNLTDQHKLLQQFGKKLGVDVVFFNNYNRDFHGAYEGNTIYLNVNSARSLTSTFAHELFHFLKANNPKLFSEMAKAAGITETQLANYLAETKRTDVKENADVTEEIIADSMQKILNRVAKKNPNLIQRFFAWLKDTFQKFKDMLQNPKGKLTRGQYAKMADIFGKMATTLTDADGKKIFRYNNRTHNLELANGESLESLLDDTENEGSENQGFFNLESLSLAGAKFSRTGEDDTAGTFEENDEISQKVFEKYLNEGIMKMVRDTVEKEIGENVDFSKMNDPVERDKARDSLPSIRKMLVQYNSKIVQQNLDYKNRLATKIEYARRCFENDERIRTRIVRQVDRNTRQGRIRENRTSIIERNQPKRVGGIVRGGNVGLSRNVGGEVSGARKHFLKLYEEIQNENRRSENKNQGVLNLRNAKFSIGSSDNSQSSNADATGKWFSGIWDKFARALHLKGDKIVTAEMENERFQAEREKAMDNFIKDQSAENLKRLKELKISGAMLRAYRNGEKYRNDVSLSNAIWRSPSRVAERVAAFRAYFTMADRAMDKLVRLRDQFAKKLNAANDFLKTQDDNETLTNLLLDGDANEVEYGVLTEQERNSIIASTSPENVTKKLQQARIQKICDEAGVNENVAQAYVKIRQLMTKAYHALNDAKRRPKINSKYLDNDAINELKNNKFVSITKISDTTDKKGNHLVTYKEYHHRTEKYDVSESVLEKFKKDPAMQVVKATVKGFEDGEKIYHVEVREGIAELTNKTGYIPHLFQEYMIRVKDKDGKIVERFGYGGIIGSGRNQREAVKFAEEWLKKNPNSLKNGEEIYIAPKISNFSELGMDEKKYAPIMGDKDFDVMVHNIAKYNDMKIKDAKALVDGSVKMKNRHRFFGNFMQRKGAQGYSRDMQWVLRHYLNSVARYVALETEFKPQAMSLFERHFGSFENDWENNSLAKFTKQFINDINGDPSTLEKRINKMLNSSSIYRNLFTANFGERAALSATNSLVGRISYLKLGMLNISSALLNLSQLINAAGYLGGGGRLMKHFNSVASRRGKLTLKELRILTESGVLSDIGLDTATGYDKNRGQSGSANSILGKALRYFDIAGNKSMYLFQTMDTMCRISTTLAAYEQAIEKGKSKDEALNFARDVNRKSNFSYGVEDAPNMFRRSSVIGKIILQFKKYPIKQLEVIGDMLPTSKKTNFAQKAAFWLPYLLMCGLMGLPFLDWLDEMFGEKLGLFPKDFLQKVAIKGSQEIFGDNEVGKLAGNIAMYGAPAIFNIDISKRVGLSAIMPTDLQSTLLGATGSTIFGTVGNLADGVVNETEGAYLNALRNVSPGLYNIFAAYEGETLGTRGRKTSVYESLYDRMIRGMGFKSVDESLATDIQRITYNERDALTKEKQKAVDAFIKNPSSENAKRLKELGVKPDTVKKERERKKLDRLGRVEAGMTKAELERNKYLMDFAR